jgi:hypothetical protein
LADERENTRLYPCLTPSKFSQENVNGLGQGHWAPRSYMKSGVLAIETGETRENNCQRGFCFDGNQCEARPLIARKLN